LKTKPEVRISVNMGFGPVFTMNPEDAKEFAANLLKAAATEVKK
jgi:hypothetical protein